MFIIWIQDEETLVGCSNDRVVLPVPVLDNCSHVAIFQMQVSEDCMALLHSLYIFPPSVTELEKVVYRQLVWKPPQPLAFLFL